MVNTPNYPWGKTAGHPKPFLCQRINNDGTTCDVRTVNKQQLIVHQEKHHVHGYPRQPTEHVCSICPGRVSFTDSAGYRTHRRTVHHLDANDKAIEGHWCYFCGREGRSDNVARHLETCKWKKRNEQSPAALQKASKPEERRDAEERPEAEEHTETRTRQEVQMSQRAEMQPQVERQPLREPFNPHRPILEAEEEQRRQLEQQQLEADQAENQFLQYQQEQKQAEQYQQPQPEQPLELQQFQQYSQRYQPPAEYAPQALQQPSLLDTQASSSWVPPTQFSDPMLTGAGNNPGALQNDNFDWDRLIDSGAYEEFDNDFYNDTSLNLLPPTPSNYYPPLPTLPPAEQIEPWNPEGLGEGEMDYYMDNGQPDSV